MLDGCAATQRDPDILEKRAMRNLMKFNKGKCKVQHLGRITLSPSTRWGPTGWNKAQHERIWDTGPQVSSNVLVWQSRVTAFCALWGTALPADWDRWSFPLLHTGETYGALGPPLDSPLKDRHGHNRDSPMKEQKMIKSLEYLIYEMLSTLLLFSIEKRKLMEILSKCTNTWWERIKVTDPHSSQWCPVTREEAMGMTLHTESYI